jgi:flagellar biosynthesis/type III secretory pathway protein FliH
MEALRRAFNVWIKGLLKRHTPDTKIVEKISGIKDIFKEHDMAEAAYLNWGDVIRAEALSEGEAKGKAIGEAKGKTEGKTEILFRQLTRRFGSLPKWAENRLNKAKPAQLEEWADAVLDAPNLTEILGSPDN